MTIETKRLKKDSLPKLFAQLQAKGRRILAPRAQGGKTGFEELSSSGQVAQDYLQTTLSPKSAVFPRCEALFRYTFEGKEIKMEEKPEPEPTVVFGLRPCDASSFAVLNSVFSWDYPDALFKSKLEKTALLSISCRQADDYCFCTSVGGGPGDTRGSDILLTEMGSGDYLAEIITDRGRELVQLAPELFQEAPSPDKEKHLARVPVKFDLKQLQEKLPKVFDSPQLWLEQSLRCLGCGACAFVCPACVCFDLQDEANRQGGVRLRCWDSCGFSLFTLHASGHNPRSLQSQRWRQRLLHKFSYFPDRLQTLGCVGCGRCSRICPADMNLLEHLKAITEAS
jgi:formate hydrogenlyase subunit 6/NADH:ubiquinone oxidoreductase subunit I